MIGDAPLHAPLMQEHSKVTVVIPCFNAAPYISAAIESVLSQHWANLEIIVVDDGSSDGSADLVGRTFPSVHLIRQANQGVAAARNTGIAQAQGDWIAFLDADDIWLPGKLFAQYELLRTTPQARASYTAWQTWHCTDAKPSPEFVSSLMAQATDQTKWRGATGWIYPQLLLDCVVWTSTLLVHKTVFAEVGNFDASLRIGEDYDLWLRVSRVTEILRVPAPMALYRMHPASITRSVPEVNYRNLVVERALTKWGYQSPEGGFADPQRVSQAIAQSWCDFAWAHYLAGNYQRAIQASFDALRSDWWQFSALKILSKSLIFILFKAGGGKRSGI